MNKQLQLKVLAAQEIIKKAYEKNNGKLFISFSGGKDSTVLRHIALGLYPDLKVVFSNTTNELSEVIKFVKTIPNVITVKPKIPFKGVVEKYGFPLVSKETSQKINELKHTQGKKLRIKRFQGDEKGNGKVALKWKFLSEQEFDITHKCCKILKKDPLEKWSKENDLKPIIALMSGESRLRSQLSLYGNENSDKVYPFLKTGWTEKDIWDYANHFNIRFAECYYDRVVNGVFIPKRDRTGCEYCGFGITLEKEDRFERSKLSAPKRYEKMMNLKNNGVSFKTAIELVKKAENSFKNNHYLDIHGFKPLKGLFNYEKSNLLSYEAKSLIISKKCPCCESKNINFDGEYDIQFADLPNENGKKIDIWSTTKFYICNDCKIPFVTDLHLFNMKHRVTNRLVDFIVDNLDKYSFNDFEEKVGLSMEKVISICKDDKRVSHIFKDIVV